MQAEDLDYEADCRACDGGRLPDVSKYLHCPACEGEGMLNRLEDAEEGYVQLDERVTVGGFLEYEEMRIEGEMTESGYRPGFNELYKHRSIDQVIDEHEGRGEQRRADLFREIRREQKAADDWFARLMDGFQEALDWS